MSPVNYYPTLNDIANVQMRTYCSPSESASNNSWFWAIYTRPRTGGDASWYGTRVTGLPRAGPGNIWSLFDFSNTGFMHNRLRMVTASFLCKHLLIDWRWGETYFASKLDDYDLASNNGGWQWASGSGCDAAPYFRIFNPELQAKKFDPDNEYIRKWVPEFGTPEYCEPIIDHRFARERALKRYAEGMGFVED